MKKILLFILLLIIPLYVDAYGSAYIIMDTDTNRVLEGNNIHTPHLIASTTKIMTSMVVINNAKLHKEITINDEVLKSFGSGIYVEVGEKITIIDLLYGLMLRSGNDAAIALANEVGGSMAGFAYMMNETAAIIGMKNTNFINSHGLEENDKKGNTSSVYDMGLLSSYAVRNETYQKIVSAKKHTVKTNYKTYIWHNKNRLLNSYEYCTGGKTGFTELAKRTLVTTASKDQVNLTVVTFKDGNDFNDHQTLYEKYFKELKKYEILKSGKIKTKYANTYLKQGVSMSLTAEEYKQIETKINYYDQNVTNIVGEVSVSLNSKEYFSEPIFLEEAKAKKISWWQKFLRIWQ